MILHKIQSSSGPSLQAKCIDYASRSLCTIFGTTFRDILCRAYQTLCLCLTTDDTISIKLSIKNYNNEIMQMFEKTFGENGTSKQRVGANAKILKMTRELTSYHITNKTCKQLRIGS